MDEHMRPSAHIVVIGGGQSARWLLFGLAEQLARGEQALRGGKITVIESRAEFGTGLAWSQDYALEDHLASRATPLSRGSYGARQQQQFRDTLTLLQELGLSATLLPGQEALRLCQSGARLVTHLASGLTVEADFVVLATGYGQPPWPARALQGSIFKGHPGVHNSPWPAKALQEAVFQGSEPISVANPKHVLILGCYLNAIDAALSLALKVGTFRQDKAGRMQFEAPKGFKIVMGSRSGQLPRVWGQEPPSQYQPRWFCEERLQESLEWSKGDCFLPIDTALQLLSDELAVAAEEQQSVAARRRSVPIRLRIGAWRRLLARGDRAETLRRDIATVMTSGKPFGSYADTRLSRWQTAIDGAMRLWSEYSAAFCAEDQIFFDAELRTSFFNHMLPMTLNNAVQIEAMMRAGCLSVIALGRNYELQPMPGRDVGFTLSFVDELGRLRVSTFSDVVDATRQYSDIDRHPSALIQDMLRSGIIQPALRAFRGNGNQSNRVSPASQETIVTRGGKSYLVNGGIFVNPKTCEVIPRGNDDVSYSGLNPGGLYAMGPNLVGQFIDAQSLGQAQYDARRIASDICRKQSLVTREVIVSSQSI
jgi:hypothetical protein